MKRFILPILCALVFGSSYAVQQDTEKPILKVNGQILTRQDLELVKAILPLEQFKTSKGRTKLIDGIYTQFLIQKTLLEQNGMQKVTREDIQGYLGNPTAIGDIPKAYSKEGFAAQYLLFGNVIRFLDTLRRSEIADNNPAIQESRRLNSWYINIPPQIRVMGRAMLLSTNQQAQQFRTKILAGASFAKLAQIHSLSRKNVGGLLDDAGELNWVDLGNLEPELQIGIGQNLKRGLYVISAPFQRAWLLNLEGFIIPTDSPQNSNVMFSAPLIQLAQNIFQKTYPFLNELSPYTQPKDSQIEVLDSTLETSNPIVGQVGSVSVKLASTYATHFFIFGALDFQKAERDLSPYLVRWLTLESARQHLPNSGAGIEWGFEIYLAARAKVSDVQLKAFYLSNKINYFIGDTFFATTCYFDTKALAIDMRRFLLVMPNTIGISNSEPFNNYCSDPKKSDSRKMTFSLTKNTLQPVAGGFVSQVQKNDIGEFIVLIHQFLPQPMLKPFSLIRGQVEREYRRLVARKQLPAFEHDLRSKAGAKDFLKQALEDLEQ